MKLWLNVAEGAEYASVCRDLIYDACAARRIHHIRVGGRRAIRLKRECVRASVPGRPLAGQPEAWERGDLKPTVRQAQELAKYYHRPFGVLFLPQPPVVAPLASEYRRLPGVQPGVESPEFRLALRVMLQRRQVTLELSEELGQVWPEFKTSAHQADGASKVGQRLRLALGVTIEQQLAWRDEWQAWREWRAAIENAGVLVFQFPKVPLEQARGVSLFEFPVPVVGINSKEGSPGHASTLCCTNSCTWRSPLAGTSRSH